MHKKKCERNQLRNLPHPLPFWSSSKYSSNNARNINTDNGNVNNNKKM